MGKVETILEVMNDMFPNAECELVHTNGFELLIAVMLSAQTTDKSVNALTKNLFEKNKTTKDYIDFDIQLLET